MGNFDSGRKRERQRVEETPKLCALKYAREHGGEIVSRPLPDDRDFEMGTCPQCKSARHELYIVDDLTACRECHDLIYTRDSQHNSHTAAVAADPARASGEALEAIQSYVETGDNSHYNAGMKSLCALERLPDAGAATGALTPELADRILAADLNDSSALLEIIRFQICAGIENTTNRRGETLEIALRGDTLAKLARAFVTVAAFRADRANQMLGLLAAKATPDDLTPTRERLRETLRETGYQFPMGHTLDELDAIKRGEQPDAATKF